MSFMVPGGWIIATFGDPLTFHLGYKQVDIFGSEFNVLHWNLADAGSRQDEQ